MNEEDRELLASAITGTFIWNFKTGDNIVYNLEVIDRIYELNDSDGGRQNILIKPIVVLGVSVIECILSDFVYRVSGRVRDPLPILTEDQIKDFKTKKRDKLEHYIAVARKHSLFGFDESLCSDLQILRIARNRVHIQNSKGDGPVDEGELFTPELLRMFEKIFEEVLKTMMEKFPRWTDSDNGIKFKELALPWSD